jgi:hypothetical protein
MTIYMMFHKTHGHEANILELGDHPTYNKQDQNRYTDQDKYIIEKGIRHTIIDDAGETIVQARKYVDNPYCQRCENKIEKNTPLYTSAKKHHKVNPNVEIVLCQKCWRKQKTAQAI